MAAAQSSFTVNVEAKNFEKMESASIINISGPTKSGKSTLLLELLRNRDAIFEKQFSAVWVSLPEEREYLHRDFVLKIKDICRGLPVDTIEGIPDMDTLRYYKNSLLIIGDLITLLFLFWFTNLKMP